MHLCVCVYLIGRGSVLSFEPVTVSTAATYICSAYNFAEMNASVEVIVHCECRVVFVVSRDVTSHCVSVEIITRSPACLIRDWEREKH